MIFPFSSNLEMISKRVVLAFCLVTLLIYEIVLSNKQTNFGSRAYSYACNAIVQKDLIEWGMDYFEDDKALNREILEFGAGTGLLTEVLLRNYMNVTASDISSEMVGVGEKTRPESNWVQMDAWNPSFHKVDRICSASLLQWANDPAKVLKNWKSFLKEDGKMSHLFYVSPSLKELYSIAHDLMPVTWHSPNEWEGYFSDAGFVIDRSDVFEKKYVLRNSLELLRLLHGIGAVYQNRNTSPGKLRNILKKYDEEFCSNDAEVEGVFSTWEFYKIECSIK
jgi:SAM-dependent methyltransferase